MSQRMRGCPRNPGLILHMGLPGGGIELTRAEIRDYRSAVARCNYLASDRFEITFATKELCIGMANPKGEDLQRLKRLIRFLKGLPRMVQRISFADHPPAMIRAYVNSDWAG